MLKILCLLIFASVLNAHALKAFVKQDGVFLDIKSYFYANSPCKNCAVSFIKDNVVIASAKTDENGFARVKIPANEFEILIDGGLAHEKRLKFSANLNELEKSLKNDEGSKQVAEQTMNEVKFDESDESAKAYILKFIVAFIGLGGFFGGLYLMKTRK
ncbi:MAG: hypothetical protein LUC34_00080 [Campylobacter sp.]|nr:hypothetical protein [Campylobacter sp.]